MNLYFHVLVYNIYRLKYMFHFHSPTPFVPAIIPSLSQPQQPQRRRLISSRYVQLYQFPFWFCSRIGISPATSTFFPSTSRSLTAILKPSNHPGRSQCGSGSCRFPVLRIHAIFGSKTHHKGCFWNWMMFLPFYSNFRGGKDQAQV